jgi:hypothetical protein
MEATALSEEHLRLSLRDTASSLTFVIRLTPCGLCTPPAEPVTGKKTDGNKPWLSAQGDAVDNPAMGPAKGSLQSLCARPRGPTGEGTLAVLPGDLRRLPRSFPQSLVPPHPSCWCFPRRLPCFFGQLQQVMVSSEAALPEKTPSAVADDPWIEGTRSTNPPRSVHTFLLHAVPKADVKAQAALAGHTACPWAPGRS